MYTPPTIANSQTLNKINKNGAIAKEFQLNKWYYKAFKDIKNNF